MFLDRFSAHGPPPPPIQNTNPIGSNQRSYSPASRRPYPALNRPALNQRSSSLASLSSRANSSSTSLPGGAARLPNGSGLKQSTIPPPDVEDPILVLENILDVRLRKDESLDDFQRKRPEILVEEVDFGGLSLEDYIQEFEQETQMIEQRHNYTSHVDQYDQEKETFQDLHKSIEACDHVLKSVEQSLAGFQRDLGLVSTEIETLQTKSSALNTRLENRKVVEGLLGPAVEEISISPAIVKTLIDGQMDDTWLRSLAELQKRIKIIGNKTEGPSALKAAVDIKPLLDSLTVKAVERIRDYIVAQIKAIRSPNINVQIIQQQNLVKYRDLYTFLVKNNAPLAEEIGRAYVNTMRWYYLNHFTRYAEALGKLAINKIGQIDALGSDPTVARAKPAGVTSAQDIYSLGRRGEILKNYNAPAITLYLAEEDKSTHYIETPFRSFNLALLDNVSAEYSFLTEFFSTDTFTQMSKRCLGVFEPTFSLGQSLISEMISTSYDCLGMLLCIRLNQSFALELQRRKTPVAENYLNGINMLLWPRLQVAMDFHSESIKQLATTVSARSAASKLSFARGPSSGGDTSRMSTAPHYLTQRVSQFLHGILGVSSDTSGESDEPVANSLRRLIGEYEAFLEKASKAAGVDPKKRDRFLGNNYALMLAVIADAHGKLAEQYKTHFEEAGAKLNSS